MARRLVCLLALLLTAGATSSAQIISIKTVPVTQADAFSVFPSYTLGMGGVSIALADTLFDLAVNPATGARLAGGRFFSAPSFYNVSFDAGGGGALPAGAFTRSGSWYGAVSLAIQMVGPARQGSPIFAVPAVADLAPAPVVQLEPNHAEGNAFAFGMMGKELVPGLSLGASAYWARLNALDGVDLFYAGSQRVKQFGHAADVRLGLLKRWTGDQALEAVLLYNRLRMTHDVTFLDTFWDPGTQQFMQRERLQNNLDHTDIWGAHLTYDQPLAVEEPGWRVGGLVTVNRMFHPELPNYDVRDAGIRAIPWDPGDSWAANFGVGLSRTHAGSRFGFDAVYEPIWSYTWGEAPADLTSRLGNVVPAGGKTVENHFEFSNIMVRMGVGRDVELGNSEKAAGIQLGLAARSIQYWLAQWDNVQEAGRNLEEQWMEWTPTWGMSLRFREFEIRYNGRVTKGTGRPGVVATCGDCFLDVAGPAQAGGPILATPSGPLNLTNVNVYGHQLSVSLPLGRPAALRGER
ncbi:MAG TPA: hypothetical protein VNL18_02670 [Gemmatimonadales bacterium]|nr:hypothetical protein [Gemmatimonadales bacterium]